MSEFQAIVGLMTSVLAFFAAFFAVLHALIERSAKK